MTTTRRLRAPRAHEPAIQAGEREVRPSRPNQSRQVQLVRTRRSHQSGGLPISSHNLLILLQIASG